MTGTPLGGAPHEPFQGEAEPAAPQSLRASYERALTLAAMGSHQEAIAALRDVTARIDHAPAWSKYADLLRLAGRHKEAATANARAALQSAAWPPARDERKASEIDSAERALREHLESLGGAEEIQKSLRNRLRNHETDTAAMRLLARVEWKSGELTTARAILERALTLAPDYEGARADLAQLFRALGEDRRAASETAKLVADAPENFAYRALHADALLMLGDFESGIPLLEQLIREKPSHARLRCVYAQALHFAGRRDESAREFRTALDLQPGMGEAYWGLSQLRSNSLTATDVATMRQHLGDAEGNVSSKLLLHYALGQTLEDVGDFSASFAAYEGGAAQLRKIAASNRDIYNPAKDAEQMHRRREIFTAPLIASRPVPSARPESTPIFVLGMPRSGSTLVEQILASHGRVEATMELPVLENIVRDLSRSRLLVTPDAYPECLADISPSDLASLGARYLEESSAYRRTSRPYFIDKRPSNWLDAGLITMILPHAKIIDVRREPLAACFAMYKHVLSENATFPYELEDLARYYVIYVRMMAHYAEVMPDRVHFLSYERLVENGEAEIRRLLDYCGLSFEDSCFRFWETDRAIATPSAEQVRRPIYHHAVEQWRNFEPWLGPLKDALKSAQIEAAATPSPPDYERALTLAAMGIFEAALEELREFLEQVPEHPRAWQKLSELLRLAGEDVAAEETHQAAVKYADAASKWQPAQDTRAPGLLESAANRLQAQFATTDRDAQTEMLREHLLENPTDAAALHMLSRMEMRADDPVTARALLERSVQLSPFYHQARAELILLLMRQTSFISALEHASILIGQFPDSIEYRALYSDALQAIGDIDGALAQTEELLRKNPRHPRFWFAHGQQLQYLGRRDDSAHAFRTCLEINPAMGEAFWGLAELRGDFLTGADAAAIRTQLADETVDIPGRMYMYYALGRLLEKDRDFSGSFHAYQQGARLFRGAFLGRGDAYREKNFVEHVRNLKRVFVARNMETRGAHPPASVNATPIFIVGMPRAGSTLVEQILASHSQVEATRELSVMSEIMHELAHSRCIVTPNTYPDCILEMKPDEFAALGERYLREAAVYRKTNLPYFIDKRPWNWLEAGLIHLILPEAKIIDVRREPMAACFAMFKQILTNGADFSYDLYDLGRYYTEYTGLMEHWRTELPGRIHFIQYERLVEDTDTEIRRLLDYCGLPFEEACLRFWETGRAISTPSAEQVRRPIFRDALEQWRNFEPWLEPLKTSLAEPPRA
ncbi:MAG TPA: sulfotransferase [Rhizomicrobium sp.]|jgi:tetratricopeptide (TPR) repeat protein